MKETNEKLEAYIEDLRNLLDREDLSITDKIVEVNGISFCLSAELTTYYVRNSLIT